MHKEGPQHLDQPLSKTKLMLKEIVIKKKKTERDKVPSRLQDPHQEIDGFRKKFY